MRTLKSNNLKFQIRKCSPAELFTIRLEELGLVSQSLGSRLHEAIKAHYKKHPDSLEPKPCLPPNTYDMRLGLLAGEEAG